SDTPAPAGEPRPIVPAAPEVAGSLAERPRSRRALLPFASRIVVAVLVVAGLAYAFLSGDVGDRSRARSEVESALGALEAGNPAEALIGFERAFLLDSGLRERHASRYVDALVAEGLRALAGAGEGVGENVLVAASRFLEATRRDPERFAARFHLGRIYARLSDWASAEGELREAVRLEPGSLEARRYLAYVHFRAERYDEAIAGYAAAERLGGPEEATIYNVASSHALAGRRGAACQELRRGLGLLPDSELLRRKLAELGC
ncbi:MAG: tetratricopeptide repeat protein, partial [Candidatus Binatia bacterium]